MAVTVNAAYYGQAVYGVARYGQFIVSNLDQAVGTGQVSAVTVNTAAGITGVSATGFIRPIGIGQFEIDIYEVLESAPATGIADSVIPRASSSLTLSSVSATGTVNTVTTAVSELLGSVSATGAVSATGVGASELLNSVSATSAVSATNVGASETIQNGTQGTTNVSAVQPNITEILGSVSASAIINDDWVIKSVNRVPVDGVQGTTAVTAAQPNITEILTGVSAQGFTNGVTVPVVQPINTPAITGSIESLSIGGFEVDVSEVIPTGVSATGFASAAQVNITEILTGVEATGQVASLSFGQFEVDVSEVILSGVQGTGFVDAQPNVTEPVGSVSATTAVNGVTVPVVQPINTPALVTTVEGLFAGEGTFEIDVLEIIPIGVSGTARVNAVQPNTTEKLQSVALTGGVGSLEHSNTVTLGTTVATFEAPRVQVNFSEVLESATSEGFVGLVAANINEPVSGVSGSSAVSAAKANPSVVPTGVQATFVVDEIEAKPDEVLSSVRARTFVTAVQPNITVIFSMPAITSAVTPTTQDAVQFDFDAVKTLYSPKRTIILGRAA